MLEVDERRDSALGVLVDPAVVDQPDRHRVEVVELLPAPAARDDEARLLEHLEVLHDPEARHLQPGLELDARAAVTLEKPIEEMPPSRIGKRLENPSRVHEPDYTLLISHLSMSQQQQRRSRSR